MKPTKAKCGLIFLMALASSVDAVLADDANSIKDLSNALVALAPGVDRHEADLLSTTAHHASRELAREYGVVFNPEFQNFLVNIGQKKRGYCAHYARDIGTRLKALEFKTLVLHWGAAYAKSPGESNCLVVTARKQPFQEGIILDGWRRAGRLFWCKVTKDHDYEIGNRFSLTQLGGPRLYSGITAWKEDRQETAWLQDGDSPRTEPKARR